MSILRRAFVIASLCALGVGPAIPASSLEEWQPFVPEDGAFRVEMPGVPTTQEKERGFPPFDFVSTVYTARVGDDAFGLNHTDLPRVALYFKSESSILDSARTGFLEDSNASERSFVEIAYAGHEARRLTYDIPATDAAPPLLGQARMFFVKNRLYIVWAEVTTDIGPDELDHYFGSFRIATD